METIVEFIEINSTNIKWENVIYLISRWKLKFDKHVGIVCKTSAR